MTAVAARSVKTFTKVDVLIPDELRSLSDGEMAGDNEGCFRILSQEKGDERLVWRRNNIGEINAAKDMFNRLIKQGMVPYKVGVGGKASSEVMREFDPHAGEVIFMETAPIRGG